MSTQKKVINFRDSEDGRDVRQTLQAMTVNDRYNTSPSYSADASQYPDNQMPFVEKHMNYLSTHPSLNPHQYLANIRLKTRIL